MKTDEPSFFLSLVSGGIAGTTVDVALYPLDTIKTRLQSSQGFLKAGGFKGVYRGLSITAVGSAPGAALFFSSYEKSKQLLSKETSLPNEGVHMIAAMIGETVACSVRVPIEVIKQRMQTGAHQTIVETVQYIKAQPGGLSGLYTGFGVTILREIPFALIQFPIYERLKVEFDKHLHRPAASYEAALCGSISGAIAAALTTPLDVMKTRLMLGKDRNGVNYNGIVDTVLRLYQESRLEGPAGSRHSGGIRRVFFAGIEPRVMWISIGGFFFFGAYEQAKRSLSSVIR